jgi:hypothetical protein
MPTEPREQYAPTTASVSAEIRERMSISQPAELADLHSYTYTVEVKNITLSVDDEVLAAARRHAAERNSTVNALVREYLTNLAQQQDRARTARAKLRQLSEGSRGRLGKKTWTRSDLHERG